MIKHQIKSLLVVLMLMASTLAALSQGTMRWTRDGNGYFTVKDLVNWVQVTLPAATSATILSKADLTRRGKPTHLRLTISFSPTTSKTVGVHQHYARVATQFQRRLLGS